VSLASSLSLELVAEGIEHESQADYLRNVGCEYGQGFYLGRPVAAQTMGELLGREPRGGGHLQSGPPLPAHAGSANIHH